MIQYDKTQNLHKKAKLCCFNCLEIALHKI